CVAAMWSTKILRAGRRISLQAQDELTQSHCTCPDCLSRCLILSETPVTFRNRALVPGPTESGLSCGFTHRLARLPLLLCRQSWHREVKCAAGDPLPLVGRVRVGVPRATRLRLAVSKGRIGQEGGRRTRTLTLPTRGRRSSASRLDRHRRRLIQPARTSPPRS